MADHISLLSPYVPADDAVGYEHVTAPRRHDVAALRRLGLRYNFIHIPKTGGTTVDAILPRDASLFNLVSKKLWGQNLTRKELGKWGSVWHQPTDVLVPRFERIAPLPRGRNESFCVVREPAARFASEMQHRRDGLPLNFRGGRAPKVLTADGAQRWLSRFRNWTKAAASNGESARRHAGWQQRRAPSGFCTSRRGAKRRLSGPTRSARWPAALDRTMPPTGFQNPSFGGRLVADQTAPLSVKP